MIFFFNRYYHYLLITITLCFASGIALAGNSYFTINQAIIPTFTFAVLALILIFFRYNRIAACFLGISFFLSGYLLALEDAVVESDTDNISIFIAKKEEVILTGILAEMVTGYEQSQKILINSRFLKLRESDHFSQVSGKVLLSLKGEWPQDFLPGDHLAIRAFLYKPSALKTPGVFNYPQYLQRKKILVVGSISSPLLIQKIVDKQHSESGFSYTIERLRAYISKNINTMLPAEAAGFYRAILLGNRTGIPPEIIDLFKKTGVMHILAISGMHMALLGFFLYSFIYWLLRRSEYLILSCNLKKISMLLSIPPLLIYTLLAGANSPVLRSFIMSLFVIFALCTNRLKSPLTILAGAALMMLLFDPLILETASFQLSFSAVASIIIITPRIYQLMIINLSFFEKKSYFQKSVKWLFTAIAITISATIGTAPILIYHFHQISTVTIPANLVIEPLICLWSLPCGFIAIPLLFLFPAVADIVLQVGIPGFEIAVTTAKFLSNFSYSTIWLPVPPIWLISLYYLALILVLGAKTKLYKSLGFIILGSIFIFALTPLSQLPGILRKTAKLSFIAIGQGNSSLIELASGRNILIDGGATTAPGFNSGERIIAPYLWYRGIGRIHDIIITHADADHYNGIAPLIERFHPDRIWFPNKKNGKSGYDMLINNAVKQKIQLLYPEQGTIILDQTSSLEIVGKSDRRRVTGNGKQSRTLSQNDSGLVIRLKTPGFSALFPGDISSKKEMSLVKAGEDLKTDILLAPHHGSSTSNSPAFLAAVQPDYLIVSTGDKTKRLFPAPKTLLTVNNLGIEMLTTLHDGTIVITGEKHGYRIQNYNGGKFNHWSTTKLTDEQ